MKQKIISILLLLIATYSWAQDKSTSASDEKQRIPIKPIVIEGEVTGVPDGTRVDLQFQVNKSNIYSNAHFLLADTIRNGKFRIEKNFIFKDFEDSEDNENYMLHIVNIGMPIYAHHGSTVKVKVTGTPDPDFFNWNAESNHCLFLKKVDSFQA